MTVCSVLSTDAQESAKLIGNHDEDEANKGGTFLKDAYVVQQSGLRQTYAFKTTYDVTFSLAELYGVK